MDENEERVAECLQENDVRNLSHYKRCGESGGMEPIQYMAQEFTAEGFVHFCKGNVIKYIMRYEFKNKEEDLRKAQAYCGFLWNFARNKDPLSEISEKEEYRIYEYYPELHAFSSQEKCFYLKGVCMHHMHLINDLEGDDANRLIRSAYNAIGALIEWYKKLNCE